MELLPLKFPKTWLRLEGWRRHGLLDPFDCPGEDGWRVPSGKFA